MKLTAEQIEAGKSPAGGWTKAQLAKWGVPWPPPKGWKEALLAGVPIADQQSPAEEPSSPDVSSLLHQLVVAVYRHGREDILTECPQVLDYCRVVSDTRLPDAPF